MPQGTLFGRNVTGGAIVITTHKPSLDERFLEAQATVGNLSDREFDGLISLPLNDSSAVKLSTSLRKRDGYVEDRLTGQKEDGIDSQNLRGQFRFLPAPGVDVLLSADYAHYTNAGRTLSSTTLGDDGNRRTSELGINQNFGRTLNGTSAQVTWEALGGEITSITAYRQSTSGEVYSGVGANYGLLTAGSQSLVGDSDRVDTFSQELRFASRKWAAGDFVTGFYLSNEKGNLSLARISARASRQARDRQFGRSRRFRWASSHRPGPAEPSGATPDRVGAIVEPPAESGRVVCRRQLSTFTHTGSSTGSASGYGITVVTRRSRKRSPAR